MAYIKKLVMQGFKSFPRRTEIPFENAMNVIVGPNGSGKSNITDALCFVLGRIGTKSIRAEKAANLLFRGNKYYKASPEAVVELIFDNEDGAFSLNQTEISIKRIVRRNGVSIYKINNETKTRQELIELLAHAGIDPNGFNLVLQGEIAKMVSMSPMERRRIIEDVAGISIYETRKEKSIKELEKTDEKLKETNAILREKNNHLKNLEEDRQNAMNYKKMEISIKQCKAGILSKDIKEREKELEKLDEDRNLILKRTSSLREKINQTRIEISSCEEKVNGITGKIESSSGGEQELLHKEIADLRAILAGHRVRRENYESRIEQNKSKIENLNLKIKELEEEINNFIKKSPEIKKQKEIQKDLEDKIDDLEKKRRIFYNLKSEISTLENKKEERKRSLSQFENELDFIDKTLSQIYNELKYAKSLDKADKIKNETSIEIEKENLRIQEMESQILFLEKRNAILEQNIIRESKLIQDIGTMDECPLCKNKITEEHRNNVIDRAKNNISSSENNLKENQSKKDELNLDLRKTKIKVQELRNKLNEIGYEIIRIKSSEEKKEQIKKVVSSSDEIKLEIGNIDKKLLQLVKDFDSLKNVEERYEEVSLRLKELSLIDIDLDGDNSGKQREIERMKIELKSLDRDNEDTSNELKKILEEIGDFEKKLRKKEQDEQELFERFQKLYGEKNEIQDKQKALETNLMGLQHEIRSEDEKGYSVKLREAEIKARLESLENEFENFKSEEIPSGSRESLVNRLSVLQVKIGQLGSINMKALETYDQVKTIVEAIEEKVNTILGEKEKIKEIILAIDRKKKKSFMKTLDAINILFTRNFSQISTKGEVYLELENKQEIFEGGLDIVVKFGRGKYFDITSMSGGEKTMISLSLIFAIQEHNPYCFYILDEIDSALDKHNSELLAGLLKKYMLSGQYIVITHNDSLIEATPLLFGVSMQEGVSKIVSQRL